MRKPYISLMEKGLRDFDDAEQFIEYLVYKSAERVKLGYFKDFTIYLN